MMMSVSSSAPNLGPAPVSVTGLLSLLQETDPTLKQHALTELLKVVDQFWHEISEVLPDLEALFEEEDNKVAASLASRVFFYLQEPASALRIAVAAGLQLDDDSAYTVTLTRTALDSYIKLRQAEADEKETPDDDENEEPALTEEQLEPMVISLLQKACNDQQYKEATGTALEARHLPQLEAILTQANDIDLIQFANTQIKNITNKTFRVSASQTIAKLLEAALPTHPAVAYDLVLVYQWLGASEKVAGIMKSLLTAGDELTALQLAFELQDSGDQAFVQAVAGHVGETNESIQKVLTGGFVAELALSFLHKQSHADRGVMTSLKTKMGERSSGSRASILHNAAVVTHGYLYAGTTNDSFLRDNLEWMKKASNWAKFTATASLGVVHASHVTEAMQLLEPYLPAVPTDASAVQAADGFAEGGSLYALGLIHGSHPACSAEKRQEALTYLRQHLRLSHANEAISHGASLGVGLTSMGSVDMGVLQELKNLLDTDSAVSGEAAGIAIGMVLVGTGAGNSVNSIPAEHQEDVLQLVMELKTYARETHHEKIIRGISMGLALMNFGQEENADALIEEMRSDRDPILRYGAQYATALAYAGTGSSKAIRILLHTAVSDVSDDVRMAAVIGLAFVLYKTPEKVPQLVQLLLESFNPHVRYASCMAVGIAMAGTGDAASVELLEPMLEDMTDYVRQGALMGTAMIYMQQSDTANGRKIRIFREKLHQMVSEKHQTNMTKVGAILSAGIIDAGGRNCIISLGSRNGFTKMSSVVGLSLWLQYWHWYPMMHMFSLALTPTLTIGLNSDLKFPKGFEITCNSKPSVFAYPKKIEEKKGKAKKRVETVTLSITAKEKARQARKKAKMGDTDMDVEEEVADDDKKKEESGEAMDVDKEEGDGAEESSPKKKKEPEPTSFTVSNPARITLEQSLVCEFDLSQRYRPVRPAEKPFGVIVLTDSTPSEEDKELGAVKPPSLEPEGEVAVPDPFMWTPPPLPSSGAAEPKTEEPKTETES